MDALSEDLLCYVAEFAGPDLAAFGNTCKRFRRAAEIVLSKYRPIKSAPILRNWHLLVGLERHRKDCSVLPSGRLGRITSISGGKGFLSSHVVPRPRQVDTHKLVNFAFSDSAIVTVDYNNAVEIMLGAGHSALSLFTLSMDCDIISVTNAFVVIVMVDLFSNRSVHLFDIRTLEWKHASAFSTMIVSITVVDNEICLTDNDGNVTYFSAGLKMKFRDKAAIDANGRFGGGGWKVATDHAGIHIWRRGRRPHLPFLLAARHTLIEIIAVNKIFPLYIQPEVILFAVTARQYIYLFRVTESMAVTELLRVPYFSGWRGVSEVGIYRGGLSIMYWDDQFDDWLVKIPLDVSRLYAAPIDH